MRTLVVLAVLGVCSASYQASNYGSSGSYGPAAGYVQPRYTGPLAATVPAGVGGKVIQVADTYEVAAARDAFFRAYDDQVATISSLRYATPNSYGPGPSYGPAAPVHAAPGPANTPAAPVYSPPFPVYLPAAPVHAPVNSYSAPGASYGVTPANFLPVRDTPEVAAAKAEFFTTYQKQAAAAAAAPDHYTNKY